MAETMNTQQSTSSAQPAKNPSTRPNTAVTHANEVPALDIARLRLMNAKAMPNMISPHTRTAAGDSVPAVPMMVELVISTLYAGAVPAMPMMTDSTVPSELAFRVVLLMPG